MIPSEIATAFWDVDDLSLDAHAGFVITRIITAGTWPQVQWLQRTYGNERIRQHLLASGGRGLGARDVRYWALVLGIDDQTADG